MTFTMRAVPRVEHRPAGEPAFWDNDLAPDPRSLAARIARIERHLGLDPDQLTSWFDLDPPDTWMEHG